MPSCTVHGLLTVSGLTIAEWTSTTNSYPGAADSGSFLIFSPILGAEWEALDSGFGSQSSGCGCLRGRIEDFFPFHHRKGRQPVWLYPIGTHDVPNRYSTDLQRIGDQRTMASPGHCLGTHDRDRLLLSGRDETLERRFKLGSLHIIRVAPEGSVPPARVGGIRPGVAQPSQILHLHVGDSRNPQGIGQYVAIELRIVPRLRDGPYVRQPLDAIRLKHSDERFDRASRMADRQHFRLKSGVWSHSPGQNLSRATMRIANIAKTSTTTPKMINRTVMNVTRWSRRT